MSETISSKALKVGGPKALGPATPTRTSGRLTLAQRIASGFTRPHTALPLIIVSLALLTWSAVTYVNSRTLVVNARPRQVTTNVVVTPEAVAKLESEAKSAAEQLIHDHGTITRTLSQLEQQARALGFQVEVSPKPAVTNAAGFRELTIYPATIALENDSDRGGSAFNRLLAVLRDASYVATKVEVAGLSLRSKGDRFGSAQVELNFWSIEENDKTAAK